MEGTPTFLDYTDIMQVFMSVDGVVRVHNLRLWGLSINKSALSAHLAIGKIYSSFFFVFLFKYSIKTITMFNLRWKNTLYLYELSVIFFNVHHLGPDANPEEILRKANDELQKRYDFFETTLQIERFQADMEDCKQCAGPVK